ncbi:MAG: hypothetical protein J5833_07745 [Victivallales bacterium]|nr:hypothetical protein [Victivallales bacterium]
MKTFRRMASSKWTRIAVKIILFIAVAVVILSIFSAAASKWYYHDMYLHGPASIVGETAVIYEEPAHFLYTNPMAMMVQYQWRFLSILPAGLILSFIISYIFKRLCKCICFKYMFAMTALLLGLAAFAWQRWRLESVTAKYNQIWDAVKICKTRGDFEKAFGAPVFSKVAVHDKEWYDSLGWFGRKTFHDGKDLYSFETNDLPHIVLFVWCDGDDVIDIAWRYAAKNTQN